MILKAEYNEKAGSRSMTLSLDWEARTAYFVVKAAGRPDVQCFTFSEAIAAYERLDEIWSKEEQT